MRTATIQANVCAGLALLLAGMVFAQAPAAPPAFEVASVKPAPPPTPGMFKVQMGGDPGMVDYKNVSLKSLIARALRFMGAAADVPAPATFEQSSVAEPAPQL